MDFIKRIFKGTNGTLHAVLLIVLGVSLLFKFPGNELVALVTAIVAFVGLVREWLKEGVKFEWASNAVAYIIAGLSALFPHLAELFGAGAGLVEAILSNNINLIITAGILFLNMLLQQIRGGGDSGSRKGPWGETAALVILAALLVSCSGKQPELTAFGATPSAANYVYDECQPGQRCAVFVLFIGYERDRLVAIEDVSAPGLPSYGPQQGWTKEFWMGIVEVRTSKNAAELTPDWANRHISPPVPYEDASRAITVWVQDAARRWIPAG
jgi:hypothetical protein